MATGTAGTAPAGDGVAPGAVAPPGAGDAPGVGPLDAPGSAGPTGAGGPAGTPGTAAPGSVGGTAGEPGATAPGSAGATQPAGAASGKLPARGSAAAAIEPASMAVTTIPPTVTIRLITLSCPSCHTDWQGAQ